MKKFLFLSFCFVLCGLFAPVNASAADGTIGFTGAIVEPPCTIKSEVGLDTAISCYSTAGNDNIKITDIINKGYVANKVAIFGYTAITKSNFSIVFINYN